MANRVFFAPWILWMFCFGAKLLGQPTGQTSTGLIGTITDSGGAVVPSALVHLQRLPVLVKAGSRLELALGEVQYSAAVTTDSIGSYSFAGLPSGKYLLCASVPAAAFLDPCKWSKAILVSISGTSATSQSIKLSKGVFLRVHVSDPGYLLPPNRQPLGPPPLTVGVVFGSGGFLGASYSPSAGGADFQMPIPVGISLKLWICSSDVSLVDGNGNPVNVAQSDIPFVAASSVDQTFNFTVVGKAQ